LVAPSEFHIEPHARELGMRTREFIDRVVIPAEGGSGSGHGPDPGLVTRLRHEARAAGVFAPTAPRAYGGLGLSHRDMAIVLEEAGRSILGPAAMNCAAPDEGNILLLDKTATPAQRARYLEPLSRGSVRSCFAMTEPAPGAGSDPTLLMTTAVDDGGQWRISGRKWFTTGVDGAAFAIVMARTGDGATMFLVDTDNPGMRLVRLIDTIDTGAAGGHGEVTFTDCVVDADAILGAQGEGFAHAQVRLGPARLTHCMRWLGAARRCHETAVAYAVGRTMFGTRAADLGMVQHAIADNEIDIAASRALIWQAAYELDCGRPARSLTSMAKTFVAEATFRIADRSMQICGGTGVAVDGPIGRLFTEIRPFRIYDGPSEVHRWSIARRTVRRSEAGLLPGDWAAS
jgi:acyl-CoA dehydrogenase